MRKVILAAALMSLAIPSAILRADPPSWAHDGHKDRASRHHKHKGHDRARERNDRHRDYSSYDHDRPDPRYGSYRADRYYRGGDSYRPRRLVSTDRIYRGSDNRYYCRRNDGTTGLIIGGLIGGVLGNAIAPGGSKTLGTLIGGGGGALLGRSVDRGAEVTCR